MQKIYYVVKIIAFNVTKEETTYFCSRFSEKDALLYKIEPWHFKSKFFVNARTFWTDLIDISTIRLVIIQDSQSIFYL